MPEAEAWLALTVKKFEEHLLPTGLAEDGAQVEGATFWASTMQYRLFFMDALRRVTGHDLYPAFERFMSADLAFAQIAAEKQPGWNEADQTVVFSPSYGQLDYYAPVLLALAREYGDTTAQHLALWDKSLGQLQKTRYVCPSSGEQLLFELGGYAALWYDPAVAPEPADKPLSYKFPSVGEAYARASWEPGGIVVGLSRTGRIVAHAGGQLVLAEPGVADDNAIGSMPELAEAGEVATLTGTRGEPCHVRLQLHRPDRLLLTWEGLDAPLGFQTAEAPRVQEGVARWTNGVTLHVAAGEIQAVEAGGHVNPLVVGMGRLTLRDPNPQRHSRLHVAPEGARLSLEIRCSPCAGGRSQP